MLESQSQSRWRSGLRISQHQHWSPTEEGPSKVGDWASEESVGSEKLRTLQGGGITQQGG